MAKTETKSSTKHAPYMQNRELSWLDFDARVFDQAIDPTVPLLERLKFLAIASSNLQEFYMVRVGSLTDLSLIKKEVRETKTNMTPSEQISAINAACHRFIDRADSVFETVRSDLRDKGLEHITLAELSESQREWLVSYLEAYVTPLLSPQVINPTHPFPHLENGELYIAVDLREQGKAPIEPAPKKKAKKNKEKGLASDAALGLIPLPRGAKRIIKLPSDDVAVKFVLLENALELVAADVFSMYDVESTSVICVTRNADLDTNEETDEADDDYRKHMKQILKKRSRLAPVRLETQRALSSDVQKLLLDKLNLGKSQVFQCYFPLDMSYVYSLSSMLDDDHKAILCDPKRSPQWPSEYDHERPVIEQVFERDALLCYPFESIDPFVKLLREAAKDPKVISIKITLYRLASQSHIAEALIEAAENGKEVTALFELRARFDEDNNIEWSERLERAGCNVLYGFRSYKAHSKICCITCQTEKGIEHITQLGTGNYNEKTSALYTDYSFITTSKVFGRDAVAFFRNVQLENISDEYETLWVAPLQIKQKILLGIDAEIAKAKAGEDAYLFFKTNSVTDKDIIEKIVEASQAGVEVLMFVRGISCLVPGIKGYTENVRVVSIVGTLLEHSRIYVFGRDEKATVLLSSADLMTRNMDNRVEIAWPLTDQASRKKLQHMIEVSLSDTIKLRELLPNGRYTELGHFQSEGASPIDAQMVLIEEARQRRSDAALKEVAAERGEGAMNHMRMSATTGASGSAAGATSGSGQAKEGFFKRLARAFGNKG